MAVEWKEKDRYGMDDLLHIMAVLRSEDGCPWDREQTHESIRRDFIEEVYEAIEAIDLKDRTLLLEELGDVLLQVVFHSRIEEEKGGFDFQDVTDGVCKKLIVRHPHIFSDVVANTSEEVLANWDRIKQQGKGQTTVGETLDSVAKSLPGLMYAEKVQKRAGKGGCTVPDLVQLAQALRDKTDLLSQASDCAADKEEAVGDLLFLAVAMSRQLGVDPEESLVDSTKRFISRFHQREQAGEIPDDLLELCPGKTLQE